MTSMVSDEKPKKRGGVLGLLKDIVYGMASHEMTRHAVRQRASMEHLFILITMGICSACRSCRRITRSGSCLT